MIDGFFSRPDWTALLFNKLIPNKGRIEVAFDKGKIGKVAAILVAHSHHDHAMDSAVVAKKTNALMVGSESTLRIARAAGVRDRLCSVQDGDKLKVGKFEIEIFATPHSPTLLGGTINPSIKLPARLLQYKSGVNFSFLLRHPLGHILIIPSANSFPGMLRGARADVVFLGVGRLGKRNVEDISSYWREAVLNPQAKLAIPIHWDDFTQPFSEPLRPLPFFLDNVEHTFKTLAKLVGLHRDGVQIRLMPLIEPVSLPVVRRSTAETTGPFVCARH